MTLESDHVLADETRWSWLVLIMAACFIAWQYLQTLVELLLPGALTARFGTIAAVVMLLAFLFLQTGDLLKSGKLAIPWSFALAMWAVISAAVTTNFAYLLISFYEIVTLGLIYTIFVGLAMHNRSLSIVFKVLVVLAALNAAIALWGVLTGQTLFNVSRDDVGVGAFGYEADSGRAGGLRGENYMGMWVAPALAAGLFRMFRKPYGPLGLTLTGLASIGIIVSNSRTSMVSMVITGLTVMILVAARGIKVTRTVVAILGFALIAYVAVQVIHIESSRFTEQIREQQESRWSGLDSWSESRLPVWEASLSVSMNNLLFGNGPAANLTMIELVSHNSFLDMLLQYGLIGLLIFCIPSVFLLHMFVRHFRRVVADDYLVLLYACLFGMTFAWLTLSCALMKFIWIVMALTHGRLLYVQKRAEEEAALAEASTEGEYDPLCQDGLPT